MTDLDNTEILSADESLTENSSTTNTKASLNILSGTDPQIFQINNETTIGRSNPSDLIIAAPSLSKQHAKITINNGQYFLTDLGSSNKTFHNKVQLQSNVCYALHDGDEIKFGDVICSFKEEKKSDTNPSSQTITNAYDDQEPREPIKIWNQNGSSTATSKQNGTNESPNKSSSSFAPHPSTTTVDDDDDGDNLIIGSTSSSSAVPIVTEPKESADEDQPEVASDELTTKKSQSVDAENEHMEASSSNTGPKIVELPEESEDITEDLTTKRSTISEEQMDTDQATDSPPMVIDDKLQEDTDDMLADVKTDAVTVDETNKSNTEERKKVSDVNKSLEIPSTESEKKIVEPTADVMPEAAPSTTSDVEEEPEESAAVSSGRGVARRNVRRARGRRGAAAARARVISTRLHGTRRNPVVPVSNENDENNTTLEETVTTETEESPKKSISTPKVEEKKPISTPKAEEKKPISTPKAEEKKTKKNETATPTQDSSQTNSASNVRVSARIKERVSTGRNRQFPYTDDYVDLDNMEKQSKANTTTPTTTPTTAGRKSNRGRASASPQKRISLRQQPIDASESFEQKEKIDVYEQMDTTTTTENKEPTPKTAGRKRKSTTPVSTVDTKRSRPTTPQTVPTMNSRRKQPSTVEVSPTVAKTNRRTTGGQQEATPTTPTTPKRGRKSTKVATPIEPSPEKQTLTADRPVRIALSSHLNFDQHYFDTLRKLGFEIMDESCHVDALVVDRIRRTKKFFMCLARGALILSPTWIELMIKENRYVPYEKYYLEDTNAETRYGFQLRESVRLAKQGPIFRNYKFFCTKDTSPPYDDLKDIIEAAGGKLIDKINMNKPGKDIVCIVAQVHKNEYEDLFKKAVPIVSEEFILSGISKQKLDFDAFSLFQNVATVKSNSGK